MDDSILMQQVADGQAEALSELYDRYARLVYSLIYHILGNTHLAEEVTQDVFFQVWKKAKTYHAGEGSVINWLAQLARNRAIDGLRRQNARPEGHLTDFADGLPDEFRDGHDDRGPELILQQRRIREAISHLPPEQQQALALAYFYGYTQQEIAEVTAQPLGTVKTRIRLAMQKLKQALEDEIFSME